MDRRSIEELRDELRRLMLEHIESLEKERLADVERRTGDGKAKCDLTRKS